MEILEVLKLVSGGSAVVALLSGIWVLYKIFDHVLTQFLQKLDQIEVRHFETIEKLRTTIDMLRNSVDDLVKDGRPR